jgi:DNA-binding response OmpR family regulator
MDAETAVRGILIVDDDPLIRTTLSVALATRGYLTTAVADPRDSLAQTDPDAVLLDATIPGCSLSECLALLGRRSDGSARPILVMSGSLTRPDELAGTGIGYLTKPIPLEEFFDAVEELVASTSGTVA